MMKKFWTTVLGSFVGVWLGLTLFSVISVIMSFAFIGAMSNFGGTTKTVEKNSIFCINLAGTLSERAEGNAYLSSLMGDEKNGMDLQTLLKAIKAAKDNDNVKGISLECNSIDADFATLYEIRNALIDFKRSKKFIYAYGDEIAQDDYYLASVADSVFMNTYGTIDLHGLSSVTPYFKTLLDKVGVEMQVIRVGTFKSAVEPFMLTEMSEANRLQQEHYLGSVWSTFTADVAKSRNITVEQINQCADSIIVFSTPKAILKTKLVDALCYRHQYEDKLRKLTDVKSDEDLNYVGIEDIIAAAPAPKTSKNKVAVFYAVGEIDGPGEGIDSKKLAEDIVEASKDNDVKAVVLRVNSPGGSAFGAEQIWAALEEVKKANKPYAVSMGGYAASGGYYISCGADRIFAEPNTITGSIGVFGVIPCFENLAVEKLGVNICEVNTNSNALMTSFKKLTPLQREHIQQNVNAIYELFTSRCATGRNMPIDSLKQIAEGRVWDGATALKLKLVDEYGNLDSAVKWVADKAKLTDYEVEELPVPDEEIFKYISKYMDMRAEEKLKENIGVLYQYHNEIKRIMSRDHVQCIMEPMVIR